MIKNLPGRFSANSGKSILKYCGALTGFLALVLLMSAFTGRVIKNKHFSRASKGAAVTNSKPAAPTLSYGAAQTFILNTAITPVTPTASNVSAPGYKAGGIFASLATSPTYLRLDSHGNIYFLDSERKDVKKLDAAGNLSVYSSGYDNPSYIAMDGNDNLYVLEYNLGYVVKTYASDAHTEQIATGITNLIVANKAGDLYYNVYDGASHLYKKFAADGHSQDLGITFVNPVSMAVDGNDNVYVLDNSNRTITKIKPDNTTSVEVTVDATQSIVTVAVDGAGDIYWNNQTTTLHKKLVNSNTYQDIALPGPGIYGLVVNTEGKIFQGDYSAKAINQIIPSGGYYIDKRLPEGLAFDIATGTISGTPTAVSAATAYNITAYNNTESTTTTFTLGVLSNNANLSALAVTGATISPAFGAGTITYSSSVASTVASVNITPTVADAAAAVTYNGNPVTSGSAVTVPLAAGTNSIAFIVTAPAGNTKTYTITITKAVPPTISYGAAQTFALNTAITPVTPTASNVSAPGYKGGGIFASLATNPTYLRLDSHGNIYFLDSERKDVKKLDAAGNLSVYSSGYDNPSYIAMDGNDNLYVLEYSLGYVVKTYASDAHTEQIATGITNLIVANKAGDLYYNVYDGASHLYKKFAADGHSQDLGITFVNPVSMAVDDNDNVYVLDNSNRTITKIKPDNTTSVEVTVDATQSIVTVAVDGAGDIYWNNQTTTLHKKLVNSNTYQDIALPGPGIYGLVVNTEGKIFQGDYSAKVINQIIPSGGYYIDKRLPEGLAFDIATGTISGTPTAVSAATVYNITAYNNTGGTTTATFTLGVASGNSNLSALAVTGVTISPAFDAGTIAYSSSVASTVASVGITPTVADAGATITYNGNPVTSGTTLTVPLAGGVNSIAFIVTAPAGNTKTYTITINKLVPPAISYGAAQTFTVNTAITPLTPSASNVGAFGYGGYTTFGGSDIYQAKSIRKDSQGNLYVVDAGLFKIYKYPANGGPGEQIIPDGFYPSAIALDGNDNIYFIDVADNLLKKIDAGTVNVTTWASGFTLPNNIAATKNGTLYVADFAANTVSKVPAGGGTPVAIGTGLTQPLDVAVGDDGNVYVGENSGKIKKIWMATDGHTEEIASFGQVRAVAVDKANNIYAADVQNLRVYEIPANGDTPRVIMSGQDYQSAAGLYVDGKGVAYVATPLKRGIAVVAPTGGYFIDKELPAGLSFDQTTGIISGTPAGLSAAKDYNITAYGPGGIATTTVNIAVTSNNADLSALAVTGASISPSFDAGTITYSSSVASTVASVNITPTVAGVGAAITYNDNPVTSGSAITVPLAGGVNSIAFIVTAGAGNTKTYTITITRAIPPAISYGTTQTFAANTAITPLVPSATNVGAFGYGGYTTLGGSDIIQAKSIKKDSQGNLYVVDAVQYKIFKYPANGGPGQQIITNGFYPSAIALDGNGNIYFIDAQDNALKKIDAGTVNISAWASGLGSPYNIAATKSGTVYVADANANTVRKIPAGGGTPVAVGTGFTKPIDVAVGDDGNVYVGENTGKVKKIWMATDGHTEEIAGFGQVFAVAVDKANNVYAADAQNMRIYEIPANGDASRVIISGADYQSIAGLYVDDKGVAYIATPLRMGVAVVAPTGGYFVNTKLPAGLSFDQATGIISGTPAQSSPATDYNITAYGAGGVATATVTIAVTSNNANLSALAVTGASISPAFDANTITYTSSVPSTVASVDITPTIADTGATITYNGNPVTSGSATTVPLVGGANNIAFIVTAPLGNTKTYSITINKLVPPAISYGAAQPFVVNTAITPVTPTATNVAAFGYGSPVDFGGGVYNTRNFLKDSQGNIYLLDGGNYKLYKYPAGGGPRVEVAIRASGTGYPSLVALDAADNIYTFDAEGQMLRKIAAGTGTITDLTSGLTAPFGICVAKDGTIYAADPYDNAVKKIPAGGGTPVPVGSGFLSPTAVALDAAGNLYVTDSVNGKLKKVWVTTDGHIEDITDIRQPIAVTVDKADNVFVSDLSNFRIYELPANGSGPQIIASGNDYQNIYGLQADDKGVIYIAELAENTPGKIINPTGGYFINTKLPAGLSFDQTTGVISGTPTELSPATTYRITAYNGPDSTSARLTLGVEVNNKLTNLVTNAGTLTPTFDADSTSYKVSVANGVTAASITATLSDASNALTINGSAVTSGVPASAALNVGDNNIPVVITSPLDNSTKTYTIKIHRVSNNAALINLTTSAGALSPAFNPVMLTGYTTAQVAYNTTSVTVTPVAADANISNLQVQVNGTGFTALASSHASAPLPLNIGDNTIDVQVTAEDGTTVKTYTLTVTRQQPPSNNIKLTTFKVTPAAVLTIVPGTHYRDYEATVYSPTSSIQVTAITQDATATLTINGVSVASGTASASIRLNTDTTTIYTTITAGDGVTRKTYAMKVTRQASNNAVLTTFTTTPKATLTVVPGTDYRDYKATVNNSTSSISIIAVTQDATATVTINGVPATSGAASDPIHLNVDTNTIYATVTAGDGVTKKTYAIMVTRLPSNNAVLTSFTTTPKTTLTVVPGTDYKDYTATVFNPASSISILAVIQEATATITVNGRPATSGIPSDPVALNTDTTTIYTTVTAGDRVTKKTYAILVTRQASNNAVLTSFTTTPKAALTAVPGTDYKDYAATVNSSTSSISIIAVTQDATATLTVNNVPATSGTPSGPVSLNADTTTVYTTVTAGDGVTKKTYAVLVTRQLSDNAKLTTFTTTPKTTLTVVPGTNYKDYAATVDNSTSSISIFAVTQDAAATITVNGVPATSGVASGPVHLNVDTNTIYTTVTAGDGVTKKTYALKVTRQAPPGFVMKYEAPAEMPVTGGEIVVHQNVSPNGDGRSDGLVIEGITAHPDNRLQVMSRSGVLIYDVKGYDNTTKVFDGHSSTSGKLQQAGTYFYSLEYKVGNETKRKTGFIVLKY